MRRKKFMAAAAGILLTVLLESPAFAHGHGHYRQVSVSASDTANLECPMEGCSETGYHTHDGQEYWGCYRVCTEEGCSEAGYHTHDNHDCWGYYPVCVKEGCTETGHHTHDGHGYCGYGHRDGYCDGSCAAASVETSRYRGHHGCCR